VFFLVELYQNQTNTGNSFRPSYLLARFLPRPNRAEYWPGPCARGYGTDPCFPPALSFTCVPATFQNALGHFHLALSSVPLSLSRLTRLSQCCQQRKTLKYSPSQYTPIWRHSIIRDPYTTHYLVTGMTVNTRLSNGRYLVLISTRYLLTW